jgi:hypothetical protein
MKETLMLKQRRRLMICVVLLVAIINIACLCIWWPPPTSSEVTPADLAGTYTYQYEGITVTVYLNADSTFEIVNSPSFSGGGTWDINQEAEIVLSYQEPTTYTATPGWYVTGGILNGGYSIIGGEGDPDTWNGLRAR